MFKLKIVDHPYAQAVLTELRSKRTGQIAFRKGLVRLGRVLGLEIIRDFPTRTVKVETPLGMAEGVEVVGADRVVIVTVLRAAWPLTEGLIKIFPNARQGIISARRVEERGMRKGYEFDIEIAYRKLPQITREDVVLIADPMVATASTMLRVLKTLIEGDMASRYIIASAIATPVAVEKLKRFSEESNLDLTLYAVALDPVVDERGYIVPGLGDAGDRAFGD